MITLRGFMAAPPSGLGRGRNLDGAACCSGSCSASSGCLFGSGFSLSFEGNRLKLSILLHQNLDLTLGRIQLLAAGVGKLHAFLEKSQSFFQRQLTLL